MSYFQHLGLFPLRTGHMSAIVLLMAGCGSPTMESVQPVKSVSLAGNEDSAGRGEIRSSNPLKGIGRKAGADGKAKQVLDLIEGNAPLTPIDEPGNQPTPPEEAPDSEETYPDNPNPSTSLRGESFKMTGFRCDAGQATKLLEIENEYLFLGRNLTFTLKGKEVSIHLRRKFNWSFNETQATRKHVFVVNHLLDFSSSKSLDYSVENADLTFYHPSFLEGEAEAQSLKSEESRVSEQNLELKRAVISAYRKDVSAAHSVYRNFVAQYTHQIAKSGRLDGLAKWAKLLARAFSTPIETGEMVQTSKGFEFQNGSFNFKSENEILNILLELVPKAVREDLVNEAYCGKGGRVTRTFRKR